MGIIYKITNLQTNKVYIGKTTQTIEIRFKEHISNGRKLHGSSEISKSLREYGTINHKIEIIEECSDEFLLQREQYWIDEFNSLYTGYNIKNEYLDYTPNYWGNKEVAISNIENGLQWNKNISPPETTRNLISTTKKKKYKLGLYEGSFGHKHTEETKARLSTIAKMRPKPSIEHKEKLRLQSTGRLFYYNLIERKRICIKQNDVVPTGYIKGKGTCWVNKDTKNISIDIWDKEKYINEGYNEGRVNVG